MFHVIMKSDFKDAIYLCQKYNYLDCLEFLYNELSKDNDKISLFNYNILGIVTDEQNAQLGFRLAKGYVPYILLANEIQNSFLYNNWNYHIFNDTELIKFIENRNLEILNINGKDILINKVIESLKKGELLALINDIK